MKSKTHSPTQLFSQLESALQSMVRTFSDPNSRRPSNSGDRSQDLEHRSRELTLERRSLRQNSSEQTFFESESGVSGRDSVESIGAQLRNAWLVLEFFVSLEKHLHNAYEGSVERVAPSDSVKTYFAGNRKVSS